MVKYCCFRFDADTHACVAKGMPLLMDLGESLGVKFTFFVNMGRAFDRRITLAKVIRRAARRGAAVSMPAASKLGLSESLRAVFFNPRAGSSSRAVLQAAACAGHEISLHGGRNHAHWECSAHHWTEEKLYGEVQTGRRWMMECGLPEPTTFASPAWNSPPALKSALSALGFQVIADVYDTATETVVSIDGLLSVPTNVAAGTGTAGYLETAALQRWSTAELMTNWKQHLMAKKKLAVVYDHPFFAGTHALNRVSDMVRIALDQGFSVRTIRDIAHCMSTEGSF